MLLPNLKRKNVEFLCLSMNWSNVLHLEGNLMGKDFFLSEESQFIDMGQNMYFCHVAGKRDIDF